MLQSFQIRAVRGDLRQFGQSQPGEQPRKMIQHQTAQQPQPFLAFRDGSPAVADHPGQQKELDRCRWRVHFNLMPALALRRQLIAMQEAQIRQFGRKARGPMPNGER